MFYLIGIGLKPKHLTLEALETIKECEKVYLEEYTSSYSEGISEQLKEITGKEITSASRKHVEEEFAAVLEESLNKKICLCIYGNPFNATTHVQLLLDAKKMGVKAKAIAGISVFEYMAFTGLERYKFGRTTSIVFHEEDYEPESFYDAIIGNKKLGLHTLCLFDIKKEDGKMMGIGHAISTLERIEEKRENNVLSESIVVGVAGAGSDAQQVKAGTMDQLRSFNFSSYPQSLIVCGKLSEKEIEALKDLAGLQ